jgi:AraC-like DNA-binding protein
MPNEDAIERWEALEREAVYLLTDPDRYPPVWSVADLGREIGYSDPESLVRPLVNAGMLHRIGDGFVVATPAAYCMVRMVRPRRLTHAVGATPQGRAWRSKRRRRDADARAARPQANVRSKCSQSAWA